MLYGASAGGLCLFPVFHLDHCCDATSDGEVSHHSDLSRGARGNKVVEDVIGYLFIEDTLVSKAYKVELQSFELETKSVWYVADPNLAEIGESSFRTQRRKLWTMYFDFVLSGLVRIWKGFDQVRRHSEILYWCELEDDSGRFGEKNIVCRLTAKKLAS